MIATYLFSFRDNTGVRSTRTAISRQGNIKQAHLGANVRVREEKPSKKQLRLSCHPKKEGDLAQAPARAGTGRVPHFAAGAGNLYTLLASTIGQSRRAWQMLCKAGIDVGEAQESSK